jgi:hypothetical protein
MKKTEENLLIEQKILPVSDPFITTYTQHAHLLSILTHYKSAMPWIFSNYIQLYINKNYSHQWSDFYFPFPYELRPSDTCKWIMSQKLHRCIVERKWASVIDFIIESINSDNYVHMMINYFYVPLNKHRYMKKHMHHDIFVYGYDTKESVFYVSDFFEFGIYSHGRLSFRDFDHAFLTDKLTTNHDYLNGLVYLYKYNENCDYKYSSKNITNSIKSYLFGTVPEYWDMYNRDNKDDIVFGKEIYTTLKNYISGEVAKNSAQLDIRPFYLLYDHKKIMALRLRYMHEQEEFANYGNGNLSEIDEIENMANVVVKYIIKFNRVRRNSIIENVIDKLECMEKKEFETLNRYIAD